MTTCTRRITAGMLAVSLGAFGVYQFYFRQRRPAWLWLGLSVTGVGLGLLIVSLLPPWTLGLLGLIEGVHLSQRSDQDVEPS